MFISFIKKIVNAGKRDNAICMNCIIFSILFF